MKTKFLLFFFIFSLNAQWPITVDSALFVDTGIYPYLAVDPNDESITVVYLNQDQMRAKKYDRYGYPLWEGNTVVLRDTTRGQMIVDMAYPGGQWGQVISDDSGGVIVCWEDYRHADLDPYYGFPLGSTVYIQRVDVNGNIRYGFNGKRISEKGIIDFRSFSGMHKDHNEGYFVGIRNDTTNNISAVKRFNRSGNIIWERLINDQYISLLTSDDQGSIFMNIGHIITGTRQKIDINGYLLWPDTLLGFIPGSLSFRGGGTFADANGGAIGVGPSGYLRINRVDSTGQFVFGENGVDLGGGQFFRIGNTSDNEGGIFLSWSKDNIIKVQKISKNGDISFDSTGVSVCDNPDCSGTLGIVTDQNGGVITVWSDFRNSPQRSFYAQRIDSVGNVLWDSVGVELHTTNDDPFFTGATIPLYSDKSGGVILLWVEQGQGLRIMIKQLSGEGILGNKPSQIIKDNNHVSESFQLFQNYPNPFNSTTIFNFEIYKNTHISLSIYNILGQKITELTNKDYLPDSYVIQWDGKDLNGATISSGVYFYQMQAGEFISTKKMIYLR